MSPDIEWQFGGEADDRETIFTTPRQQPPRWQSHLLVLMIVFGVGLGFLYYSIPEPPPRPTPQPTSTPIVSPRSIEATIDQYLSFKVREQTIDREAQALAVGDLDAFMAAQDSSDAQWYQSQRDSFRAWGRPPVEGRRYASLYFYVETEPAAPPHDRVWVDINQFRDGRYFRQTRFYRRHDQHWLRTRPDPSFWSGQQQTLQSPHFELTFPKEDSPFANAVADRFEAAYKQLCMELNCPMAGEDIVQRSRAIGVTVQPTADQASWFNRDQRITIILPSPRVTGLLDLSDNLSQPNLRDPLENMAYNSLIVPIAQIASGGFERWAENQNGALFLWAVVQWELNRLSASSDANALVRPDLLSGKKLTQLKFLWDWPLRDGRRLVFPQAVANSAIVFMEQKFGPASVSKFLNSIGPAESLPQAIEASLGVSDAEFEQQWQDWLQQYIARK